ncbi:type II toxin-antitoxin system VapC family toxin [Telmatospirillum siberiense]|uniref:Ribonuclease VapC n=1 Tax=Telmatospirillum siberiense TaxID=382514 RepID=A0A2N3PSC9_9PROT|nr:type II toxin-antitoxin system VapC family toxin [Telmatospirillum siberiense]PKU23305.1 VapC toxin family PIN domain ribonuclease [Telmatospirillum siberiense]
MSGFLLDTNVISMLSPSRAEASDRFLDWLERADGEGRVFLSVVTIHEIEKGIALLDSKGATAKAAGLKVWLSGLLTTYDDKILGLEVPAASFSGKAEANAVAAGHNPGMADAIIAGIAEAHDLTVITRNVKHFRPFDIRIASPDDAEFGTV